MGSYDGAELCELIGIFTQSVLQDIINKEAMGYIKTMDLQFSTKQPVKNG